MGIRIVMVPMKLHAIGEEIEDLLRRCKHAPDTVTSHLEAALEAVGESINDEKARRADQAHDRAKDAKYD